MPRDLTDDKSTLVQVMAWCRQATSHYLSQCWPRSLSPYGVTSPQWVNIFFHHSPKGKMHMKINTITHLKITKIKATFPGSQWTDMISISCLILHWHALTTVLTYRLLQYKTSLQNSNFALSHLFITSISRAKSLSLPCTFQISKRSGNWEINKSWANAILQDMGLGRNSGVYPVFRFQGGNPPQYVRKGGLCPLKRGPSIQMPYKILSNMGGSAPTLSKIWGKVVNLGGIPPSLTLDTTLEIQRDILYCTSPLGPLLLTWISFNPSMDK